MPDIIEIKTDYITLGQFLKYANIVESGGMVKLFLQDYCVLVNDEIESRRGRKLKHGDLIEIEEVGLFKIEKSDE
ncbi:S4 domain-containing protein YaaA [Bacillaceae bacterium W0354]